MNFKKRVNGSWTNTSHCIMGTSTDTITTLPAVLYPNDTTATVGLKGQATQSGTPTPDSPIMPQGTGERTENLWNEDYSDISGGLKYNPVFVGDGTFTMSTSCPNVEGAAPLFLLAGNVQYGASTASNGVYKNRPITVTSISGYVTVAYRYISYQSRSTDPRNEQTMLNSGSTALPYEPYGYKIPISSADTTTNIYLGEVETTRKIKKLVLTGEETVHRDSHSGKSARYYIAISDIERATTNLLSSHFTYSPWYEPGTMKGYANTVYFSMESSQYPEIADFKTYLAAQYAAGTPVTVWYVLATEETGIVNEPLMKIGEYADEVSNVSIPVTAGANTLSVGTTLQPSEITVNYKGWHPVADVHERDNGAWT